jgi:hypothetical protein
MSESALQPAAPLIILCPARSFSSVVSAVLGQHPQMYAFPELHLFITDTVDDLLGYWKEKKSLSNEFCSEWVGPGAAACSPGLLRALAELHLGGQSPETVRQALEWLRARRDWSCRQVFDSLLEMIRPRVGVEKTPETAMSRICMSRVRKLYPRARFLHLTRHPVTAQRSLQAHWGRRMQKRRPEWEGCAVAEACAREWCRTHQMILDFTADLPPEQTLRVRGEDLLNEPDTYLPQVAAWLGLRTDAEAVEAMKHPERSPYAGLGPTSAWLGNDPKFLRAPRLRPCELPRGLEHPSEWGLDPWLLVTTLELARRLGYGGDGSARRDLARSEPQTAAR